MRNLRSLRSKPTPMISLFCFLLCSTKSCTGFWGLGLLRGSQRLDHCLRAWNRIPFSCLVSRKTNLQPTKRGHQANLAVETIKLTSSAFPSSLHQLVSPLHLLNIGARLFKENLLQVSVPDCRTSSGIMD